jgi:ribose-phosphate pyrophosphokinase
MIYEGTFTKKTYIVTTEKDWELGLDAEDLIDCKCKTWSGGEEDVVLSIKNDDGDRQRVKLLTRIASSSQLIRSLLVKDALERLGFKKIILVVPYLPYARQDKAMNEGESFSLQVFARIINSSNFYKVIFLDPHSLVSPALIDRSAPVENHKFLGEALYYIRSNHRDEYPRDCVLVSPDAGAYKKIFTAGVAVKFEGDIVACNKVRNLKTSEIVKMEISSDVTGKICIIVDDICDGGRTFKELAEILKSHGAKKVILVVTHGIFSYGIEPLVGDDPENPLIDEVYTTDSFKVHSFVTKKLKFTTLTCMKGYGKII